MANLTEISEWVDGIYQLERTDKVDGGSSGIHNLPLKQLANRTSYLKERMSYIEGLVQGVGNSNSSLVDHINNNFYTKVQSHEQFMSKDGRELKTINGESLVGSGDITIDVDVVSPLPTETERNQLYFVEASSSNEVYPDYMIFEGMVPSTQEELDFYLNSATDFGYIFSKWQRFSHFTGTSVQPASPADMNSWTYNSTTKQVICAANTDSYIGFISTYSYKNYELTATLSSSSADDDGVGIVIAFAVDENGKQQTISMLRSTRNGSIHGTSRPFQIVLNHQNGSVPTELQRVNLASTEDPQLASSANWNSFPNGVKVVVRRENDIIRCYSSAMNDSVLTDVVLEVDLSSDPRLSIFRGKKPYGFSAHSQDASTFSNVVFKNFDIDKSQYIYDVKNDHLYEVSPTTGLHVRSATKSIQSVIGNGRILRDIETGKVFYTTDRNTPEKYPLISGGSSGGGNFSAAAWVQFNGTGTVTILDGGNCSSITDDGTSLYKMNFITPMRTQNYAVVSTCRPTTVTNVTAQSHMNAWPLSTTQAQLLHGVGGNCACRPPDSVSVSVVVVQ